MPQAEIWYHKTMNFLSLHKRIIVSLVCFSLLILAGGVWASRQTVFSVSPNSGNYKAGDNFQVELMIRAQEPVTSLKTDLLFDSDLLEVKNIDVNKETFPFWWETDIEAGKIVFQASTPAPGFQGEAKVASLSFTAKKEGTVEILLDSSSLALTPGDKNIISDGSGKDRLFLASIASVIVPGKFLFSPLWVLAFAELAVLAACVIWFRSARRKI